MSSDPVAVLRQYLDTIRNVSGELGELSAALSLWGQGDVRAQLMLLSLRSVAAQFATVKRHQLHRGFLPSREQWEQLRARRRIVIVTPAEAPLASWSLSPAAVKRVMKGSDTPWMSIRKQTADLDVIINCAAFHRQARGILRPALDPFQQIDLHEEVIVKMPAVMWVPSHRITICS